MNASRRQSETSCQSANNEFLFRGVDGSEPDLGKTTMVSASECSPTIASADGALSGFQATGMDKWEAFGHMASVFNSITDWAFWAVRKCSGFEEAQAAADSLSVDFPTLADHLLREGLRNQRVDDDLTLSGREWITVLPQGLQVTGHLELVGCRSILELPEGLQVGGNLNLLDCAGLVRLPIGLVVGKDIFLDGCIALNGILPSDAKIGRSLYTTGRPGIYRRPGDPFLITRD